MVCAWEGVWGVRARVRGVCGFHLSRGVEGRGCKGCVVSLGTWGVRKRFQMAAHIIIIPVTFWLVHTNESYVMKDVARMFCKQPSQTCLP